MAQSDLDVKERVRDATDLADLIGTYLGLRRQGRMLVGHCPWHDDSRPSLQVNPTRQTWKCWVCDIGGDVFDFIMKREAVGFREALEMLADRAGIPLTRESRGARSEKQELFRLLAWAERQFVDCLRDAAVAHVARDYLQSRKIAETATQKFRLGYSPPEWDWLRTRAMRESFTEEQLQLAGLVIQSDTSKRCYDRFRGRLLFSIRDEQGRTVGFGGRALPAEGDESGPKYINSPETRLFSKSNVLYGLDAAREAIRQSGRAIVMEGYTDVIMAHQFGLTNAVAVLGTALGERHLRLLLRFSEQVVLVLDGDAAGQRRTNEILDTFLRHAVDLRIATLPDGMDPCDFLLQHGKEAFDEFLAAAADAMQHRIQVATRGVDLGNDLFATNRAIEEILRSLALIGRDRAGDLSRRRLMEQQVLAMLARRFHVDVGELRQRLQSIRRGLAKTDRPTGDTPSQSASIESAVLDKWDRALLEICVHHPALLPKIKEQVDVSELMSRTARSLFGLCSQLHDQGVPCELKQLMLRLEDPAEKSLLVELDEQAANRSELSSQRDEYLDEVLRAFEKRRLRRICRAELKQLDDAAASDDEKLEVLERILQHQRMQQGL